MTMRRWPKYVAYDTETTGLSVYQGGRVFSYSFGFPDGSTEVYRLDSSQEKENRKRLQDFFDDIDVIKVAHNAKFDMKMTRYSGIHIPEGTVWHDTMIMSQLLRNNAPSHALDALCWELCGYPKDLDREVHQTFKVYGNYQKIPVHLMTAYQHADAERGMLLFQLFYEKFILGDPLKYADYQIEMRLLRVMDDMEDTGIDVCLPHLNQLILWLEEEIERIVFRVRKLFGEFINLNSEEQVANLLYRRVGLPILAFTDAKKPSTSKDTLLSLKSAKPMEILDLILKQRSYTKGLATLKSYLEKTDNDGKIHANLKGNHAITGRMACSDPNLMNVSKEKVLKNPFPIPARRAFKVSKGTLLIFADYAGIEMRLGIGVSHCTKMIQAMHEGKNVHEIAARIFYSEALCGSPFNLDHLVYHDKITNSDLYGASKNNHFALMYGAGLQQKAATLMLPVRAAKIGDEIYKKEFPEIYFLNRTIAKIIGENGYITTPFGRKLNVFRTKAYAGLNFLIQGTAAGILKRALVAIYSYLKTRWCEEIKIVLPIHDEIVFKFPRHLLPFLNEFLIDIRLLMITMPEIDVPLEVEYKMTDSTWDKAKKIEIISEDSSISKDNL